jgi:ATP-dependent DNA helicase RecQ
MPPQASQKSAAVVRDAGQRQGLPEPVAWAARRRTGAHRPCNRHAFAYVLAWLRVSGGNSVLPPWVRRQFPETTRLIRRLRETPCNEAACPYCPIHLDPCKELERCFGYAAFRPEPKNPDGGSLQEDIVRAGYAGESLLAILPTGGGKSICYQLPALSRHWRNGSLSIIISPLQSLMKDQVDNLIKAGIYNSGTLNGMLTMPERRDVLDKVRLGDIGILLVSPEQFRNRAFVDAIRSRQIGAWIFDEAHCLSKWGNDFRPDYLYVSRFIRERHAASAGESAPVSCFTATAKREVVEDIRAHFQESLGLTLRILDGGHERENLHYEVIAVGAPEKNPLIHRLLENEFGPARGAAQPGGAVVFAGKRGQDGGDIRLSQGHGLGLRPLSRRARSRLEEGHPADVHPRRPEDHRRHQRLRHGRGQA